MNHIYRLVWSVTRQAWTAVAEWASGRGRAGRAGGRASGALRTAFVALPAAGLGLAALAQTVTLAPGQVGRAYVAPNGATVLDISAANGAGVSHNRFTRYDVGAAGLVLNNTTNTSPLSNPSQLAGSVLANVASTRAANVIVNEVVSGQRSVLAGFTEVAGQRAQVVVANPWGITCTGCGFINTDRATLSTGVPAWDASGALGGLAVGQGDILVNGAGLNATAQEILDLVTRSVRLEAPVHAKELGVSAGTGEWSYTGRGFGAAGSGAGGAPAYAIDATALGAMYANQIRLVANEAGVGVRMLGEAAAQVGDVRITAAGRVELAGALSAAGTLQVASAGDVDLSGALLGAGQSMSLAGRQVSIRNASHLQAGGALAVTAAAGLAVASSGVKAAGDVTLAAQQDVSVVTGVDQGVQSTGGKVTLQAGGAMALASAIAADGGDVRLQAGGTLSNSGTVQAGKALGAQAHAVDNTGTLLAVQALDVHSATGLANSGVLQGASIAARGADIANHGTTMATATAARLEATNTIVHTGLAQAQTDLVLATGTGGGITSSGRLLAGGGIDLATGTLDHTGLASAQGALHVAAATASNAGTLQGATLALEGTTLGNTGTLLSTQGAATVTLAGRFTQSGTLQGANGVAVTAQTLENAGDMLAAAGSALVDADTVTNAAGGSIASAGTLALQAGSIRNAGRLGATGAARIAATGNFYNDATGTVQSLAGLELVVGGDLDNLGRVQAGGAATVTAGLLSNDFGAELRAAQLTITAGAGGVANLGRIKAGTGSGTQGTLAITTTGDIYNDDAGVIEADGLHASGKVVLNRGAVTVGAGGTTVKASEAFRNAAAATFTFGAAGSSSEVTAGLVGNLGTLQTSGNLRFTLGGQFDNGSSADASARVLAGGDLSFRGKASTGYRVVNHGTLDAQGELAFGGAAPAEPGVIVVPPPIVCTLDYCGSGRLGALDIFGNAQGGTVNVASALLNLGAEGVLLSRGDMQIATDRLTMAEAPDPAMPGQILTSRILGGMAGVGTPQVTVASLGTLDVAGLVYSKGDLQVSAPDINVGVNGALAALNNLDLRANRGSLNLDTPVDPAAPLPVFGPSPLPGNLTNLGTLYAGNTLSARVNGTFTNAVRIEEVDGVRTLTAQGAIAAGQNIDIVANTLVNNSDIRSEGDIRIVATSLRNEVQGGDRRVYTVIGYDPNWANDDPDDPQGWHVRESWDDGGLSDGAGNTYVDHAQNLIKPYLERLAFAAGTQPLYWPTLTAANDVALYFNSGKNLGGLIQGANKVVLQGFAARGTGTALVDGLRDDAGRVLVAPQAGDSDLAVFVNDSLAQVDVQKFFRMTRTWKDTGSSQPWRWCTPGSDAVCTQDGRGSTVPVHIVDTVTPVLPAGYSGARIYTATLEGGNFTLFNEGSSTRATYERGDPTLGPPNTVTHGGRTFGPSTTTVLLTSTPARPAPVPGAAQSSVLPGDGTQTGWTPVSLDIVPTTATATGLQTGLAFGGVQVKLPTNANGLFVIARDPNAGYLIESNPLFRAGAAAIGTEYLRERLGYSPDEIAIRLGDGSYEAWLVQQQMIAQTGNMLLAGYASLDAMMKGLMDNAAGQAAGLGLVWGQPLTAEQIAGLKSDIVWMVKTTLNGVDVLVPVVYLSQATKDGIQKGAIIQATTGTLTVNGQANSGTVSGVTTTNVGGGQGPASLFGFGSGGASAQNFNDQSFEIVKSYLLSAGGGAVGVADVTGWLEKNKANPEELGKVMPYAFQRFMALSTGGGAQSDNDKAFVAYVGEYAKQQRLAAIDEALATYAAWKKGPKLGQQGNHALLTSLFDLGESPPDNIMKIAQAGITMNEQEMRNIGIAVGTALGISVGAGAAGHAAGGASVILMNQIFPFLARSASSTITAGTVATGPVAIVTTAVAIAGQAIAKIVKDASFEKDLRKLRDTYAAVAGNDIGYWMNLEGGAEQIMLSMAKMLTGSAGTTVAKGGQ